MGQQKCLTLKKTLTIWTYIINIKMFFILESPEQNTGYEEIFSLNQEVTSKRTCVIFLVKPVPWFLIDFEMHTHAHILGIQVHTYTLDTQGKEILWGFVCTIVYNLSFSSKLLIHFNNPIWPVESIPPLLWTLLFHWVPTKTKVKSLHPVRPKICEHILGTKIDQLSVFILAFVWSSIIPFYLLIYSPREWLCFQLQPQHTAD